MSEHEHTTMVSLTDAEMVLLDGKCSDKVQAEVNAAKARVGGVARFSNLTPNQAKLVASIIERGRRDGKLAYSGARLRRCDCCGKFGGYVPYARAGRKAGMYHKAGDPSDKPRYLSGIEFADSFVRMEGYPTLGACDECVKAIMPTLVEALRNEQIEVSRHMTGETPKWRKRNLCSCTECDWTGHEGQLGLLLTLSGNGHYRGECPSCGAKNGIMSTKIKTGDGFVVVRWEDE
jgi:hypothetical protein